MQHLFSPKARKIEDWAWWEGAFSKEELDFLQEKAKQAKTVATIGGQLSNSTMATMSQVSVDTRRSYVDWLEKTNETAWVFDRLEEIVQKLNLEHFGFDLTGFGEPIQLTNYVENDNGMYSWHQDYNALVSRKLSLVLQLSEPSSYDGGNLQLMCNGIINIKKQRGFIVCFPSYIPHQVTPVEKGNRQSLVVWISGPKFK